MDTQGVFRVRHKESSFEESKERSISHTRLSESQDIYGRSDAGPMDYIFWIAVAASQVVGVICAVLIVYWCVLNGGFDWSDSKQLFFVHPLCMVLGLILCYGDAILVYRIFSFLPKLVLKWIHACLHIAAIILSSVGLIAVFENHRREEKADLYSLHSWVGLGTFTFFCLQYVGGFVTFLYPGMPMSVRAGVMPYHTFFGVALLLLAVGTAEMGMTERLLWADGYTKGILGEIGTAGNVLGLFLIIFAFLVVFLVTHSRYKRRPLPSEIAPTN